MTIDEVRNALERKVYLGDGLFAHFDGYQIILTAPRDDCDHYVALEPEVLVAFDIYRENLNKLIYQYKNKESQ